MILKIVDKWGGFYYADQIHRCSVQILNDCSIDEVIHDKSKYPRDGAVLDSRSSYPIRKLVYRTLADALVAPYVVLFNADAYFLDDRGKTIEKI